MSKSVKVSEHALLRYLERIKGMDMKALREEVVPKTVQSTLRKFRNGSFPVGDHRVIIKDGYVITVVSNDMKRKYR